MTVEQINKLVINRMSRAMLGDDEALNEVVMELRPLAVGAVPSYAHMGAPIAELTREAVIALHEALILWQPPRENFVECLDRRIRLRLGALFLRLRDLQQAVCGEEVAADAR